MNRDEIARVAAKIIEVIPDGSRIHVYQRSAKRGEAGTYLGDFGSMEEASEALRGFLWNLEMRLQAMQVIKGGKAA